MIAEIMPTAAKMSASPHVYITSYRLRYPRETINRFAAITSPSPAAAPAMAKMSLAIFFVNRFTLPFSDFLFIETQKMQERAIAVLTPLPFP